MPTPIITIQKVTNAFAVTIIRIDTDGAIVRSITPKDFDYRINALTNGFSVDIFDDGVIAYSIADIAFIVVGLNLISDTPAQKEIQLQDLKEASGGTVTSNDPALTATAPFVTNSAADILRRIEAAIPANAIPANAIESCTIPLIIPIVESAIKIIPSYCADMSKESTLSAIQNLLLESNYRNYALTTAVTYNGNGDIATETFTSIYNVVVLTYAYDVSFKLTGITRT